MSTEGELDLGHAPMLVHHIDAQIGGRNRKGLMLDSSDFSCVDSSGLPRALGKRARER
jgi:hypothetical protein